MENRESKISHLYIHVPFCVKKCLYCAFASQPIEPKAESSYLDALETEITAVQDSLRPQTIFIGGGTPSCLSEAGLERLFNLLEKLDRSQLREFSLEANPATLNANKARILSQGGVNRISLGAQSLNDTLLKQLGRIHSAKQVVDTYDLLRKSGFNNISLDIIFAVPGQSLQDLKLTLQKLLALKSKHLSCYEMTYEEGTPLTLWRRKTGYEPDEILSCNMYDTILDTLHQEGIERYEISNFSRKGRECTHNIAYWRGADYYGAGPAACSLIKGVRYGHTRNLEFYCNSVSNRDTFDQEGTWPDWEVDRISPLARAGEIAGVGLRMSRGWQFDEFYARTGFHLQEHWGGSMERLVKSGNGEFFEGGFRLTRRGLRFADLAAEEFILI